MTYPIIKTSKAKAWAAALGTLATALTAVFADDVLDTSEVTNIVGALIAAGLTVLAVYQTENKPESPPAERR